MTALIIDGKCVANEIKQHIQEVIIGRIRQGHRAPGLAVILLGEDAASSIYVNIKRKVCQEVGFISFAYDLPLKTREKELLALIDGLNSNPEIDGILVQLPLPPHINTSIILERISPKKDVDGFHPYNLGRLAQGNPFLRPCTPYGVIQLLNHYKIGLRGINAVVVGASNIVGRPMALELLLAKSTVTICHSATKLLKQHVLNADLIIVAAGSHKAVKTEWLNKNHIVIDIGIHRDNDGHIHGDIDFDDAKHRVQAITPVPGGVGPMTICTLLQNTLLAAGIRF